MKYCSHCGASVGDGAGFCSSCGRSLTDGGKAGGFWKGVAAAIVGVGALLGILWATAGSNSADRTNVAGAAEAASEPQSEMAAQTPDRPETYASPDTAPAPAASRPHAELDAEPAVVVEEPGFVGKLFGEEPRVKLTVSEGTALELELATAISTETASTGDRFTASLLSPLVVEGHEALPAGTEVSGHIAHAVRADKVKGRAALTLELDRIVEPDGTEHVIQAEAIHFEARSTTKEDAIKIGGASGAGALVGAIIGGKKGAAIGAGVGAGAGTGVVLNTRGEEVVLGEGATLSTTLSSSFTVERVLDGNDPS